MIVFENDMLTIFEDLDNHRLVITGKDISYNQDLCDQYKLYMSELIDRYNNKYEEDNNFCIVLCLNFSMLTFKEAYIIAKNIQHFHYDRQHLTDKFIEKTIIFCKSRFIKFILNSIIRIRKMPKPVIFTREEDEFNIYQNIDDNTN